MLRTEGLVYAGSGRNIFSATYTPPAPSMPKNVPPARPKGPLPPPGPPVPVGPPPPPPIPLKFFGTAQRPQGLKQVFLLSGDDVYSGVQVTDLLNNNTQTLPMQQ